MFSGGRAATAVLEHLYGAPLPRGPPIGSQLVGGDRVFEWLFRNRQTGEITIAQRPNASLLVVLTAWTLRWAFDPSGGLDAALAVVGTVALVIWALDELVRGVNPWRRLLGGGVLVWQVVALAIA